MKLKIVPIKKTQLDLLATFGRRTFYEAFHQDNNPADLEMYLEYAFAKAQLQRELSNPDCHFFFAYYRDQHVGYLKINTEIAQNEYKTNISAELERIYVDAKHQRKGIGKQLLDFAENYARERDMQYLWLGVWERNPNAIRLYQRCGYEKIDTHIYVIGTDPQTDYIMRKNLTYERTD
ncbi:GNAT family N-acetyltransferase [Dokdonia sinensis]|uniref:GNAT family N-acetyltransferase n=1 Tax=Dokdonia sinensis TaxID=2479847 RepID=A0A3M0FWB3_9FLAO|nr:GNAT family N-acetyltransferase [Dokdonia sinensis]RMB56964.1 GNAT family N-acetyltransferase [Dokdonia sinensis]